MKYAMRKLLLAAILASAMTMPAMAYYDPEASDEATGDRGSTNWQGIPADNTWYGSQWRSGTDTHSDWHDSRGNRQHCVSWYAGTTLQTRCD